jgi:hypothetical protein
MLIRITGRYRALFLVPWTILLFSVIHLKVSPEVEFPVSLSIIPAYPKEDTLDILLRLSEFAKRYMV